ncbi:caffeine-induced death protein 2-domain-containing protein [Flagelloscypha sp. PMI_526]|nr:caffeine-induced death protein 2-domain-containing protein [Flagelloscypha sp. PMI_526]
MSENSFFSSQDGSRRLTQETIYINASTCMNLSLFKEVLKEYRKVDDQITTRLNRAQAMSREHGVAPRQDETCAQFWRELVDTWTKRQTLVQYCIGVAEQKIEDSHSIVPSANSDSPNPTRAKWSALQVTRDQLNNEATVEKIIRNRSLQAFRSRCRYFTPPADDQVLWEESSKRP